ncbi:transcriptional regulator swi6 [Mortierella sp. GBA30]|nr:transcriptional regulator swi6 [Mortierella sp. GBA30]
MSDNSSNIYTAVYSGVPVYEVMCRGIAVMRRKQDSYLNATQLLKVAGIDKGKRTKILEREVLPGEHEKVQGGYGKYQGTWVPFQRGKDLAKQYKVEPYLRALFNYEITQDSDNVTPTKEMVLAAQKARDGPKIKKPAGSPRMSPSAKRSRGDSAKPSGSSQSLHHAPSMTPSPLHPSFNAPSPSIPPSPKWHSEHQPRKRFRTYNSPPPLHEFDDEGPSRQQQQQQQSQFSPLPHQQHLQSHRHHHHRPYHQQHHHHHSDPYGDSSVEYYQGRPFMEQPPEEPRVEGAEQYRNILMSTFLNDDQDPIPDLLTDPNTPADLDINLVIDDQGHTALHWAAALARIPILELLVQKQADVCRVNFSGESALVRAVLVTNNFDKQSFPQVLNLLHPAIPLVDSKNRTLLHHIAITAGIRGREGSSRYYMECLLEWIARRGGDFGSIVDVQDKNGDTALTIAARVGDRYLCKILLDVGANREIENKVGLKADDFGLDESQSAAHPAQPRLTTSAYSAEATDVTPAKRGKELMSVVQKMVDDLDLEFSREIMARQGQLQDTQALLRHATSELSETRRTIQQLRIQARQLAEAQQKIKNLEQSLEEESQKARNQKGYSSSLRHKDGALEDIDSLFDVAPSPKSQPPGGDTNEGANDRSKTARETNVEQEVHMLRARILAYEQNEKELAKELTEIKDQSLDKELQCRKVISICCNIPLENVDEMLVPLTQAVESDGASLDLSRVAGFMSKVKQQDGIASTAGPALSLPVAL